MSGLAKELQQRLDRLDRVKEMVRRVATLLGSKGPVSYYVLDGKLYRFEPDYDGPDNFAELGDYHSWCAVAREKLGRLLWRS
jgi:hypothetical protein